MAGQKEKQEVVVDQVVADLPQVETETELLVLQILVAAVAHQIVRQVETTTLVTADPVSSLLESLLHTLRHSPAE